MRHTVRFSDIFVSFIINCLVIIEIVIAFTYASLELLIIVVPYILNKSYLNSQGLLLSSMALLCFSI